MSFTIEKSVNRSEPRLWVSRIVILESVTAEAQPIRDITLRKGLNVVWAKEPDTYDPLVGISGHSAGKTSFCRLVRYLLGESKLATAENETIIGAEFPEGYVGAEMRVLGKSWAVLRPLGTGRLSYAIEGVTLGELLIDRGKPLSQPDYVARLGLEAFIQSFPIQTIPQSGETMHWGHVLAWITRDQENRFRNLHDWRSPSSESNAPEFRFRKEGPLFLLRAALGHVEPAELGIIQAQKETAKNLERLKKQVEDRERDAKRLEQHYRLQVEDVAERYGVKSDPTDGPLFDQPGLRAEDALKLLDEQISHLRNEREELQRSLDDVGAEILDVERSKKEMESRRDHGNNALDEVGSSSERRNLSFRESQICPFGQIIVRDCDYYQRANEILSIRELRDTHEREQAEARRVQVLGQIATELASFESRLLLLRSQRTSLVDQRSRLDHQFEGLMTQEREVRFALEGHKRWVHEVLEKVPHDVLTLKDQLLRDEQRLRDLAAEHQSLVRNFTSSLREFEDVFAMLVTFLLGSNGYRGSVRFDQGSINFDLTEKEAPSGEAVRTLIVLLSDIACMIFGSTKENPSLPGFLLHDSPRDADLGGGLYERLFLLAVELTDLLGGTDSCCFQYIITTTTAPPAEVMDRDMVRLRLDASDPKELLFRRRFSDLGGLFTQAPTS